MDTVIISDYNKGLICDKTISLVISWKKKTGGVVVVDTKRDDVTPYKGATTLTPNLPEAIAILSKLNKSASDDYISLAETMRRELDMTYGLITLGENGATIATAEDRQHIPAVKSDVYDVTGAGDTFIAVFTYFISSGTNALRSVEYSVQAASHVVGQLGTAVPDISEICSSLSDSKISNLADLLPLLDVLETSRQPYWFYQWMF